MKNKKKLIAIIASLLVVASAAVIVVYAYLYQANKQLNNTLIPAQASCKVHEEFADNKKTGVTVENTSTYDAYIRIVAVTYWQDTKGNVVGREFDSKYDIDIPSIISDDWIPGGDNIYYYKEKVSSGHKTADLFENGASIVLNTTYKEEGGVRFDYYQVVEFIAEAIQAAPEAAVENSWTDVEVDASGKLSLKPTTN